MKSKNIVFVISLIILSVFTFQSCVEEEGKITSFGAFTQPALVAPANDAFITVSGTTVTLQWSSSDSDNDPDNWDVYFGTSAVPPLVKRGHTSQSYSVTVANGNTYYWQVVGHDANGIPTESNVWSFSTIDPAAEFDVTMEWTTDVESSIGLSLDPDEVVDLRLLVVKESDKSIVAVEDGASFEEYTNFNSLADGTYLIATDIYSTINAGDFNAPVSLTINLIFSQTGIVDESLEFANVMTNEYACDAYRTYLAKIVKAGTSYTISKNIAYMVPEEVTWYGEDATYESEVTTVSGCTLLMSNLGGGWMLDWWGEVIVDGGTFVYTVDDDGNVTIPMQYYCTTTYNGAVQPDYSIEGSGTLDESGAYPVMTLHYDFIQQGTYIGAYCFDNYGWTQDGFDAVITTDPSGKGGKKGITVPAPKNLIKPVH